MIKRIYLLLLVLLFATSGVYAQERTIKVGEIEAGPGLVSVPVEMLNFTNLNGFQLSFTYDPSILTPIGYENRFITGGMRLWDFQVGDGELIVFFFEGNVGQNHDLNGKAFDIKFQYSGAFDSDIEFNLSNTEVMTNNVLVNNNLFDFVDGAVTADPDVISGTVSMETIDDVLLGTVVEMPIYLEGDGFNTVAALDLQIGFDPVQLLFEGVDVMEGVEIAFTTQEDDGSLQLAWAGTAQDFTTRTHIANIRFSYNAVAEAAIEFLPGTEVSSDVGALPIETVDGLVIPRELDAKITIPDVYQYSGVDVAVPISLSGIDEEFPSAGSITLKLAFDPSLMTYASYTSDYSDAWSVGTSTAGLIELTVIDIEGIDLDNDELITLNFNFLEVGTSQLDFVDGSNFLIPEGGIIPFNYVNGSVEVSVPGNVYEALLDARENSGLTLTNPDINELHAAITYPDEFIVEDELGFDVLTDIWKVDADIRSSHAIPAGTVMTLTNNDVTFDYVIESEVAAGEVMYLSDMILSAFPESEARATLLHLAGEMVEWHFDLRSPLTYETTFSVAVITSHDDFVVSDDGDRKGFVLAEDEIDVMVYGDPKLLFAFNDEVASTGSEFEYCYDVPVTVTIAEKLEGGTSFDITYTVNGEEATAEGVEVGGVVWGPDNLEAGTYEVVVTNIVDNFGRDVVDPQDIYYATVVINPEPAIVVAVNGVALTPGAELEICYDTEVTVTLLEALSGEAPMTIVWTLNDELVVTNEDVAPGAVLYEGSLPVGVNAWEITSIVDGNGCAAAAPSAMHTATFTVNPEPSVVIAVNGTPITTGAELEICYDTEVTVTLHEALAGTAPMTIVWTLNDDLEVTNEDVAPGAVLYEGTLPVGVNAWAITSIVDANGCSASDPADTYNATITVNPEPSVVIAVNGEPLTTGAELEICYDTEVVVTLHEALAGAAPMTIVWTLNGDLEVTNEDVAPGSVLYEGTLPVGVNAWEITSIVDANGCAATDPEDSYNATFTVFDMPDISCPADTVVMLSHDPFTLAGGTPEGGVYSGTGVEDGVFSASVAGVGVHTLTYTVTSDEGCVAECMFTVEVKLDTSVPGQPTQSTINLYPNPARTVLNIVANDEIKEIRMVDMLGQVVFTSGVQYTTYELNVSNFKNGIYFVQVLTEKGFTTHRVQITR